MHTKHCAFALIGYGMSEWREDLKKCFMKSGLEDAAQTFLFCDSQVIGESMLEDINIALNYGDVPNMYKKEDMEEIVKVCKYAKLLTKSSLSSTQTQRQYGAMISGAPGAFLRSDFQGMLQAARDSANKRQRVQRIREEGQGKPPYYSGHEPPRDVFPHLAQDVPFLHKLLHY